MGHYGVIELDARYYRIRVLQELSEWVEIELVDYGSVLSVKSDCIFAPTAGLSPAFFRPSFGIHLDFENSLHLPPSTVQKTTMISRVGIVQIQSQNDDGSYKVKITDHHMNSHLTALLYSTVVEGKIVFKIFPY